MTIESWNQRKLEYIAAKGVMVKHDNKECHSM